MDIIKSKISSGRRTIQVQVRDGYSDELKKAIEMICSSWYGSLSTIGKEKQHAALKRVKARLELVIKKTINDQKFLEDLKLVNFNYDLQSVFFKFKVLGTRKGMSLGDLRNTNPELWKIAKHANADRGPPAPDDTRMLLPSKKNHLLDLLNWKPTISFSGLGEELKIGQEQTLYVLWLMKVLVARRKGRLMENLSARQAAGLLFQFLEELRDQGKKTNYWSPTADASPESIMRNVEKYRDSGPVQAWSTIDELPIERIVAKPKVRK